MSPFRSPAAFGAAGLSLTGTGTSLLVGDTAKRVVSGKWQPGGAYLFTPTSTSAWALARVFSVSTAETSVSGTIGYDTSISPDGSRVVASSLDSNSTGGYGSGAAFLWTNPGTGWSADQGYGSSVSVANNGRVLVGVNSATVDGYSGAGRAQVYDVS